VLRLPLDGLENPAAILSRLQERLENWPRMNANERESEFFLFAFIRVHSRQKSYGRLRRPIRIPLPRMWPSIAFKTSARGGIGPRYELECRAHTAPTCSDDADRGQALGAPVADHTALVLDLDRAVRELCSAGTFSGITLRRCGDVERYPVHNSVGLALQRGVGTSMFSTT